jgi:hypothetical protein
VGCLPPCADKRSAVCLSYGVLPFLARSTVQAHSIPCGDGSAVQLSLHARAVRGPQLVQMKLAKGRDFGVPAVETVSLLSGAFH